MTLFDVRELFLSEWWVMAGTLWWAGVLAIAGLLDTKYRRVPVLLCAVLLLWPAVAMSYLALTNPPPMTGQAVAACFALLLLMLGWASNQVGMADVLVIPGVVLLLGVIGIAAVAVGFFVGIVHVLMDRTEGEGVGIVRIPGVAYAALPSVLVVSVAYALVMEWL